jgi:hypothetical protein
MFAERRTPEQRAKRQRSSVWASYAANLLLLAAVFGGFGLLLLLFSFLSGWSMGRGIQGIHGLVLGDLTVAVIAALIGFSWRWRGRRSSP